jgi:signal transduction histidine kinase
MNFLKMLLLCVAGLLCSISGKAQNDENIIWSSDNDLLSQISVESIIPDKYDYLWPTTENDLLQHIKATAHYFMENKKGFFWIPTNKGLFQVKKDLLLSYAKNPKQSIYYHFYNKDSGFLMNDFNGGASPFSGTYILTARMLTGFDSKYKYKKTTTEIGPYFYETTWFLLTAALLFFMLTYGFIKLYSKRISRKNQYLLREIELKTNDLRETIGTLRLTKDSMKMQSDRNNKLIQIISHDIKSPVKFMSMASKYMYDDFDPNSPDLKENILAMHTSSSQIYNFLDNILFNTKVNTSEGEIDNQRFLLHDEIQEKIVLFKDTADAAKTQLINSIPQSIFLNTNKTLFAIIVHNLLDNALQHKSVGIISFSVVEKNNAVFITIKDNGGGIDAETLQYYESIISDFDLNIIKANRRLGLHLVIELMLILSGEIELESQLGIGTSITLKFQNQAENESS